MHPSRSNVQLTMSSIDTIFPDEVTCFKYLLEARSVNECPWCGRQIVFYRVSMRRLRCPACEVNMSLTAGSIFFRSGIPLRSWFQCVFLMCIAKPGVSARYIARYFGIQKDAAWRMASLIRLQMARLSVNRTFGGVGERVELDETLIKHLWDKEARRSVKATIFGISDGKYVWTSRVRNRSRRELQPIIQRHVREGTIINTDGFITYSNLANIGYQHRVANHSAGFWVGRDGGNTLHIDSYWAYLKRTLARTYVCVGIHNIDLYLKEVRSGLTIVMILQHFFGQSSRATHLIRGK